ncbi:hypothetical protein FRC12_003952 [Ceratobasidium sp. 428]|nr:hypothetical protein FRC12_003952 [Ceratobasidium sp. 428]
MPVKVPNGEHSVTLFQLLSTTETLWGNNSMPLDADTYASVLVSTADIIQLAISLELTAEPQVQHEDKSNEHVGVEVTSTNLTWASNESQLAELRAHYSKWLARVTMLLKLYKDGEIIIKHSFLDILLGAITTLARCGPLNPVYCISTHHPQPGNPDDSFGLFVPSNKGVTHLLQANDLYLGPLTCLIRVFGDKLGVGGWSPSNICRAALEAYSALAPVLMQHILGISRDELNSAFECNDWESGPNPDMNLLSFTAVRLGLLTARYLALSSELISSSQLRFLDQVILLVYRCLLHDRMRSRSGKDAYSSLLRYGADLVPLLELINDGDQQILSTMQQGLIYLVAARGYENYASVRQITLCETLLTPKCFPPLVEMLEHTTCRIDFKRHVLQALVQRMRGHLSNSSKNDVPTIEYLRLFNSASRGFSALVHARRGQGCVEIVEKTIVDITHLAAGQDPSVPVEQVELWAPAVPGFLDAVSAVAQHITEPTSETEKIIPAQLVQFSNDSLDLIKVAVKDPAAQELIRQHSACQDLWRAIHAMRDTAERQDIIKRFLDAQSELGIELKVQLVSAEKKKSIAKNPKASRSTKNRSHGTETDDDKLDDETDEDEEGGEDEESDEDEESGEDEESDEGEDDHEDGDEDEDKDKGEDKSEEEA